MKTLITLEPENSDYRVQIESGDQDAVALRLTAERTYEAILSRQEVDRLIDVLAVAAKPPAD